MGHSWQHLYIIFIKTREDVLVVERLAELARLFLILGFSGFGGPVGSRLRLRKSGAGRQSVRAEISG